MTSRKRRSVDASAKAASAPKSAKLARTGSKVGALQPSRRGSRSSSKERFVESSAPGQGQTQPEAAAGEEQAQSRLRRNLRQTSSTRERAKGHSSQGKAASVHMPAAEQHQSADEDSSSSEQLAQRSGKDAMAVVVGLRRSRRSGQASQSAAKRAARASTRALTERTAEKQTASGSASVSETSIGTDHDAGDDGDDDDDDDDDDEAFSSESTLNASRAETTGRTSRAAPSANAPGAARSTAPASGPCEGSVAEDENAASIAALSVEERAKQQLELERALARVREEAELLVRIAQTLPSFAVEDTGAQPVVSAPVAVNEDAAADAAADTATVPKTQSNEGSISTDEMVRANSCDGTNGLEMAQQQVMELVKQTIGALAAETPKEYADSFALAHMFIADLVDLERRRYALENRIQRNFELQQAYLHKYAQARFREVEHQYLVAEESLRERLLEAAFQRQRRYRIACQLDRDPMVLFGQPPVMIPPGFAGVPYQLLPARPRGASPAAMGTAANLTPEESLLLLERRPVSLGLEPGEASDDLREVQRAITALRRRAKAGNAHAGRAPGASGNETATDGQLLTSAGRAPSGPTGRQTGARARASNRQSTGARHSHERSSIAETGTQSSAHRAPAAGTAAIGNGSLSAAGDLGIDWNDQKQRSRLAVGLVQRDQPAHRLGARPGNATRELPPEQPRTGAVGRSATTTVATAASTTPTSGHVAAPKAARGSAGAHDAGTSSDARSTGKRGRPRKRPPLEPTGAGDRGSNAGMPPRPSTNKVRKPPTSARDKRPVHPPPEPENDVSSSSSSTAAPRSDVGTVSSTVHPGFEHNAEQAGRSLASSPAMTRPLKSESAPNESAADKAPDSSVAKSDTSSGRVAGAAAPLQTQHASTREANQFAVEAVAPAPVPDNAPERSASPRTPQVSEPRVNTGDAGHPGTALSPGTPDIAAAQPSAVTAVPADEKPIPMPEFPVGGDPDAFVSRGTLFYRGMQLHRGDQVAVRVLPKGSTSGAVYVGLASGSPEAQADNQAAQVFHGPLVSLNVKELHIRDAEHRVYVTWLQSGRAELVHLAEHQA